MHLNQDKFSVAIITKFYKNKIWKLWKTLFTCINYTKFKSKITNNTEIKLENIVWFWGKYYRTYATGTLIYWFKSQESKIKVFWTLDFWLLTTFTKKIWHLRKSYTRLLAEVGKSYEVKVKEVRKSPLPLTFNLSPLTKL